MFFYFDVFVCLNMKIYFIVNRFNFTLLWFFFFCYFLAVWFCLLLRYTFFFFFYCIGLIFLSLLYLHLIEKKKKKKFIDFCICFLILIHCTLSRCYGCSFLFATWSKTSHSLEKRKSVFSDGKLFQMAILPNHAI